MIKKINLLNKEKLLKSQKPQPAAIQGPFDASGLFYTLLFIHKQNTN